MTAGREETIGIGFTELPPFNEVANMLAGQLAWRNDVSRTEKRADVFPTVEVATVCLWRGFLALLQELRNPMRPLLRITVATFIFATAKIVAQMAGLTGLLLAVCTKFRRAATGRSSGVTEFDPPIRGFFLSIEKGHGMSRYNTVRQRTQALPSK